MKKLFKTLAVVLAVVMAVGCSTPDEVLEEQVCTMYEVSDFTVYKFESLEATHRVITKFVRMNRFSILDFEEYIFSEMDAGYVGIIDEYQEKEAAYAEDTIRNYHDVPTRLSYENGIHDMVTTYRDIKKWTVVVKHFYMVRECNYEK